MRFVRIYFDTPTFDRITKDRAAKFVDMLSAIGGTMGLLTGFSIISGVEIIYFAAKMIFLKIVKEKKIKRIIFPNNSQSQYLIICVFCFMCMCFVFSECNKCLTWKLNCSYKSYYKWTWTMTGLLLRRVVDDR